MVLSEECDIDMIQSYANENGFTMNIIQEKKKYWEMNCIFEIRRLRDESQEAAILQDKKIKVSG